MTERDPETARFDPRFDPAFQPGYVPAPTDAAPAPTPGLAPGPAPAPAPAQAPATFTPSHATPPQASRPPRDAPTEPAAVESDHRDDRRDDQRDGRRSASGGSNDLFDDAFDDDAFDEGELDRRRPSVATNPFLLALWLVSIAFVVGGVVLTLQIPELVSYANSSAGSTQANAEFNFYILQTAMTLAPTLIILGLATAVGIVFVYAAHSLRVGSRRT